MKRRDRPADVVSNAPPLSSSKPQNQTHKTHSIMNQEQRKQSHAAPVVPMTARDSTGDPNDVLVAAPGHAPHPGQEHSTHTDARYFEESAASTLAFWALDNSHVVAPTRDKQYLPTSISSPSASHKNTALLDSKVTMIDRNATLIASTSADEPPNVPNADNLVDMVVAFAGEHEYTTADQKESSAHSVRHRIAQDQDENKNQDSLNQRRSGEHVQNSYRTTKRNRSYHTSARNSSRTTTTTCSTADDTSQNSFLVNLLQMTTVPAISDGGATVPLPPDVVATNSYPIKMVPSFSSSDSQWERKYKTQTVQMRTVCDLFKDEARNIV